jgi:hypothetical protein
LEMGVLLFAQTNFDQDSNLCLSPSWYNQHMPPCPVIGWDGVSWIFFAWSGLESPSSLSQTPKELGLQVWTPQHRLVCLFF